MDMFTGNPFKRGLAEKSYKSYRYEENDEMEVDREVKYTGKCRLNVYNKNDEILELDEYVSNCKKPNFGAAIMARWGYMPGRGLGPANQGILTPIQVKSNTPLTGLGKPAVLNKRVAEINAEIAYLQNLKTLVTKDADINSFVACSSGTKWWDELDCASVFCLLFEHQISLLSLPAIEQKINVFRAGALLGSEAWSKLLLKVWIPKLEEAGERELEHVAVMLPYVRVVQPQLLQLFVNPSLSDTELQKVCSLFGKAKVYTEIVSRPIYLRPNKSVLAEMFPNTQLDSFDQLESAWTGVQQNTVSIAEFMHLFLEQTREKLASNTLTQEWYFFWKERVFPYNVEPYLLDILNLINSELDSSSLVLPPFSEVLELYCQTHEYLLKFDGSEYEIKGGGGSVRCFIDKDVLFLKLGKEAVPIALTDLDNLVA